LIAFNVGRDESSELLIREQIKNEDGTPTNQHKEKSIIII